MGDVEDYRNDRLLDEINPELPRITPYQQHLRDIDIPAWERGSGDWFTIKLFNLFAKADENNKFRLALGFPEEYAAYTWWYNGKDRS